MSNQRTISSGAVEYLDTLVPSTVHDTRRDVPRHDPSSVAPCNVLTIDLEDWFHVTNFESLIRREEWSECPTRLQHTVPLMLDLLAEYDVRATFFVLGWVARRFPLLVRCISDAGHEIASHGDEHRLVTALTPNEFRAQLLQSQDILQQVVQRPVVGHRAPTYSFRRTTDWAVPILLECGFEFDSSVMPCGMRYDPVFCDRRFPCYLEDHGLGSLVEYPLSTVRLAGCNLPVAGGGYFRLLPYPAIRRSIQHLNREGRRAIMYVHPWELDPDQPRMTQASWLAKFRHYHQLDRTEHKLRQLLSEFRFGSIRDVFWSPERQSYDIVPQP